MSHQPGRRSGAVTVALAVLDPADLTVKWHNEYAQSLLPEPYRSAGLVGLRMTDLLPMTDALGVVSKLREVAQTGVPHHMTTHVVGSGDSGRTFAISAYRLHSGELLLVTDQR